MFDNHGGARQVRRHVDPPTPVTVDVGLALHTDGPPLRVRAEGLDVSGRVPGWLYAWARTSTGDWLGFVQFTLQTGNRLEKLTVRQWCSQRALSPRTADEEATS
ncbi:hypothetical protein HLB23_06015 [Nocardia uniformis]|uniref:Uncharacterized protein n=1 Tax=Nocardia uniformis TaxID=53432 RepID=A0A849BWC5_9NOCA|nr:hypothetical protein [Nocardia uniformis]NNH69428.1 hypothetical protein [Nocardia uniformis]